MSDTYVVTARPGCSDPNVQLQDFIRRTTGALTPAAQMNALSYGLIIAKDATYSGSGSDLQFQSDQTGQCVVVVPSYNPWTPFNAPYPPTPNWDSVGQVGTLAVVGFITVPPGSATANLPGVAPGLSCVVLSIYPSAPGDYTNVVIDPSNYKVAKPTK